MTDVLLINTACEKSSTNPRWAGQAGERSTTPKIYPAHARHCPLLSNHLKLDSHEDGMSWTCSLGCGYLSCQWMMGITQYRPTCRYYLLQWWAHLDHPFTAWFIPTNQRHWLNYTLVDNQLQTVVAVECPELLWSDCPKTLLSVSFLLLMQACVVCLDVANLLN